MSTKAVRSGDLKQYTHMDRLMFEVRRRALNGEIDPDMVIETMRGWLTDLQTTDEDEASNLSATEVEIIGKNERLSYLADNTRFHRTSLRVSRTLRAIASHTWLELLGDFELTNVEYLLRARGVSTKSLEYLITWLGAQSITIGSKVVDQQYNVHCAEVGFVPIDRLLNSRFSAFIGQKPPGDLWDTVSGIQKTGIVTIADLLYSDRDLLLDKLRSVRRFNEYRSLELQERDEARSLDALRRRVRDNLQNFDEIYAAYQASLSTN